MAEDSYPQPGRNAGALTVLEHEALASLWAPSGVVSPGDLAVSTSATQSQVLVSPGQALVRGIRYTASSQVAVPVTPNTSGSTRMDRVVLRLAVQTGVVAATAIAGIPGGGGPPALANDPTNFDIPLSRFPVMSGQLPSASQDERLFLGGECTASDSSDPPLYPRIGHRWSQIDTGYSLRWNGSAWQGAPYGNYNLHFTTWARTAFYEAILLAAQDVSPAAVYPPAVATDGFTLMIPSGQGGLYDISFGARFSNPNVVSFATPNGQATVVLNVNSILTMAAYSPTLGGAGTVMAGASQTLRLNDGDNVNLYAQVSDTGLQLINGPSSYLTIARRAQ